MSGQPQPSATPSRTLRVAAVQPVLRIGAIDANLRRCEDLVRQAARDTNAELIVLPEAFSSPNAYHPALRTVPVPVDGAPYQLLRRLARDLGCIVGGGYLSLRNGEARHTYALVEPDGTTSLHDKDEPSAWEYCYYTGGRDDGVLSTSLGPVGCVLGWEVSRTRTARRLREGAARLIAGGVCWPGFPDWPAPKWLLRRDDAYYRAWARETVATLARAVGAPAVTAWHGGHLECRVPLMPGVPWRAPMVGETQIVERDGRVIARLGADEGDAWVSGEVTLAEPEPLDDIGPGFWTRPATASIHVVWHYMKRHGQVRYRLDKALHRFPWQALPHRDLPNHIPGVVDLTATEPDVPAGSGAAN